MLSISQPIRGAQAVDYYLELGREDYYTSGGEPPGRWMGEGAKALGLQGRVEDRALRNIFAGFSASGTTALVQNAGSKTRQAAWDLTFSAPKTVSVLWSQASPEVRCEIEAAQAQAVQAALDYLQHHAALTRRGRGGVDSERVKLVGAAFDHGTSRAQDPQVHTHLLLLNLAVRTDGTTGSIRSDPLFAEKMTAGAIYRAELAATLRERLGVKIERDGEFFKLAAVNEDLCREFSKRREGIKHAMAERGVDGAVAASIVALATRQVKDHVARGVLFEQWHQTGRQFGWSSEEAMRATHQEKPVEDLGKTRREVLNEALEGITRKQTAFSEREFLQAVAEAATAYGLDAQDVRWISKTRLTEQDIIPLNGGWGRRRMFATRAGLELEQEFATRLQEAREHVGFSADAATVEKILASFPAMTENQRAAVDSITAAPGTIHTLAGMSRAEQAEVLRAATRIWSNDDVPVAAVAPDAGAAKAFQARTGIPTHALEGPSNNGFHRNQALDAESSDDSRAGNVQKGRGHFPEVHPTKRRIAEALGLELWRTETSLLRVTTHLPHLELKIPRLSIKAPHLATGLKKAVLVADQADKLPPWERHEFLLAEKFGVKLVLVISQRKEPPPWELRHDERARPPEGEERPQQRRSSPSKERLGEEQRRRRQEESERRQREERERQQRQAAQSMSL